MKKPKSLKRSLSILVLSGGLIGSPWAVAQVHGPEQHGGKGKMPMSSQMAGKAGCNQRMQMKNGSMGFAKMQRLMQHLKTVKNPAERQKLMREHLLMMRGSMRSMMSCMSQGMMRSKIGKSRGNSELMQQQIDQMHRQMKGMLKLMQQMMQQQSAMMGKN